MAHFDLHTPETAPAAARPLLQASAEKFGMLPNLFRGLAESPEVLGAYLDLSQRLAGTTLTPAEQQAVLIAISVDNECHFCVAAHTWGAKAAKLPDSVIDALRADGPVDDPKLGPLVELARAVVRKRGWLDDADVDAFLAAGYTRANVLDVILATSLKTISNYANHVLHTPVNPELEGFAWKKADATA